MASESAYYVCPLAHALSYAVSGWNPKNSAKRDRWLTFYFARAMDSLDRKMNADAGGKNMFPPLTYFHRSVTP